MNATTRKARRGLYPEGRRPWPAHLPDPMHLARDSQEGRAAVDTVCADFQHTFCKWMMPVLTVLTVLMVPVLLGARDSTATCSSYT